MFKKKADGEIKIPQHFRFRPDLSRKLAARAKRLGVSKTSIIEDFLETLPKDDNAK